jgi:hypothetical protein
MGKDKKEQKRLQEERMDEILSRLDSIENAVNENKENIQQTEADKEQSREFAKQIEEESTKLKSMTPLEEFQALLDNLIAGERREKKIENLTEGQINELKGLDGGLATANLLLRAENNMNDLLMNHSFKNNESGLRRNQVIMQLIKALDHTTGKLKSMTGFFRAHMGSTIGNIGRWATGKENTQEELSGTSEVQRIDKDNKIYGGGKKTQRRKKHKKSGKHHKTRKHH